MKTEISKKKFMLMSITPLVLVAVLVFLTPDKFIEKIMSDPMEGQVIENTLSSQNKEFQSFKETGEPADICTGDESRMCIKNGQFRLYNVPVSCEKIKRYSEKLDGLLFEVSLKDVEIDGHKGCIGTLPMY